METYYPASSPLFALTPCKACANGWIAEPDFANATVSGTSYGWITTGGESSTSSIELNFTGAAISFDLSYATGQTASSWTTRLSINGSAMEGIAVENLLMGQHEVKLDVQRNSTAEDGWIRFDGATISLGSLVGAGTKNGTVDDTAWRDGKVLLSPGWNMLESNGSNWINQTQMDAEMSHAGQFWNQSMSWTEQAGGNTTILFSGSALWVYGATGGNAGRFEVILDNATVGTFDPSSGPVVYDTLLYSTSGLSDTPHTLKLVNLDAGKRLSFDRLEYLSGLLQVPSTTTAESPPSETPSSPASSGDGLSKGAIAGIAVGAAAVVLGLTLWALLSWTALGACLRKRQNDDETNDKGKPPSPAKSQRHNSFWRWSGSTGFSAPSRPLRPSHPPPTGSMGPFVILDEKPQTSFMPHLGTTTRQLASSPSPAGSLGADQYHARTSTDNPLAKSFLRLSRSPKKPNSPFSWAHAGSSTPMPEQDDAEDDLPGKKRKPTALTAAINDRSSPLTSLRDSYLPNLGPYKLGKSRRNRSVSVKTALDDEPDRPVTPGGILDGYMTGGSERTFGRSSGNPLAAEEGGAGGAGRNQAAPWDVGDNLYPSMGEKGPRRFFGKIMGEGRPVSGASGRTVESMGSTWRYM